MKILKQRHAIWGECPTDLDGAVLWIEKAGRVCYRSEDKIVEGSGAVFVNNILKKNHGAVIEASNLVVTAPHFVAGFKRKYITEVMTDNGVYYGGNFRAWMDRLNLTTIEDLFAFFTAAGSPAQIVTNHREIPWKLRRVTVELFTDRAVTHEIVRHRPCSFLQESQRYVSYKEQVEYIQQWYKFSLLDKLYLKLTEWLYRRDITKGRRPEIARFRLPNCTATRIVVTADLPEWQLICGLRVSKAAYPQMRHLMRPVKSMFIKRGWCFD